MRSSLLLIEEHLCQEIGLIYSFGSSWSHIDLAHLPQLAPLSDKNWPIKNWEVVCWERAEGKRGSDYYFSILITSAHVASPDTITDLAGPKAYNCACGFYPSVYVSCKSNLIQELLITTYVRSQWSACILAQIEEWSKFYLPRKKKSMEWLVGFNPNTLPLN